MHVRECSLANEVCKGHHKKDLSKFKAERAPAVGAGWEQQDVAVQGSAVLCT